MYTNPVYDRNFPDPFVLRFNGRYYAYGTGTAGDGRYFGMLSSRDLVHWTWHGGAIPPLGFPGAEEYWAPEVAYSEGRFYMYFAVGRTHDPDHHLRVAVAEGPLGPWQDAGINLTPNEIFAIDAHPFRDPTDGQWYLYYARDELNPPYAGTGNVVDRLTAMDRLEGRPREVLRPYADWQLFELHRPEKRGLDWYTVEGPFALRVDGKYVCFYSGGRWENPNYGVGYCLAESPLGPWIDDANAPGPQVLTTAPGRVIGPGHNSVVIGPDLKTWYIAYHGWDPACTARYFRVDRLEWDGPRPRRVDPSTEPQPDPPSADLAAWFDEPHPTSECRREWEAAGWGLDGEAVVGDTERARMELSLRVGEFVAEFGVSPAGGFAGAAIGTTEILVEGSPWPCLRVGDREVDLPSTFCPDAWHLLQLRRSGGTLRVSLDGWDALEIPSTDGAEDGISLQAGSGGGFSHYAISRL